MHFRLSFVIPLLAGFFCADAALRANVIYSNFGSGASYSAGSGLIVTNDSHTSSSAAIAFRPVTDYYLNSIEFAATDLIPGSSGVTVGIFADNNGRPGDAPLDMFAVRQLGQFGDTVPVLSVTSTLSQVLFANAVYWVGLNTAPGGMVVWNQNVTLAGGFLQSDGVGNWSSSDLAQGAVQIDGTPVSQDTAAPEPASWLLLAGGLAVTALTCGRRTTRALPRPGTGIPR